MKNVVLLLFVVMLLSGCSFNCDDNSGEGLALPKKGRYFCPVKNYDGSYILSEDIIDADEKCDAWKTDFWQVTEPEAYNNCLKRKKRFVERFQLGTCTPVFKRTHNEGKSGCLFEIAEKYHKIIKFACYGPNINFAIKQIKIKYEQTD